jgi:hypothetical protein
VNKHFGQVHNLAHQVEQQSLREAGLIHPRKESVARTDDPPGVRQRKRDFHLHDARFFWEDWG